MKGKRSYERYMPRSENHRLNRLHADISTEAKEVVYPVAERDRWLFTEP
jgi:hypothetical protein